MKKNLWMLGMAVAALTSCTQSEVVDIPENRVITFDTFLGKQSRTADVKGNMLIGAAGGDNDLTSFWVYGNYTGTESDDLTPFNGSDNSKVYWDQTNSAFKYDDARQWHMGTYHFTAYSNGNDKLDDVSFIENSKIIFTDYVNDGNKDLVASIPVKIVKNEGNMQGGVPLDFKHMMACIELEFTNASNAYYLDFQNLKFSAKSKSTCTFDGTDIEWTDPAVDKEYEFITNVYDHNNTSSSNNNPNVLLSPSDKAKFHCFVIPQSNATIDLSFDIVSYTREPQLNNGGAPVVDAQGNPRYDYTFTSKKPYKASLSITGEHASWKPGILYKYSASVSGTTYYINFTVTSFEQWTSTEKPAVETPVTPTENSNASN